MLAHAEIDRIFDNAMGVDDLPGALSQVASVLSSYESQIAEDSNFQVHFQDMPMTYAAYRFRAPRNRFRAPRNARLVRDPRNGRPVIEELRVPVYAATWFRPPRNAQRFRAPRNAQEEEVYDDANSYIVREPSEEEDANGYELRAPIVGATWFRAPRNGKFRAPREEQGENAAIVRPPSEESNRAKPVTA